MFEENYFCYVVRFSYLDLFVHPMHDLMYNHDKIKILKKSINIVYYKMSCTNESVKLINESNGSFCSRCQARHMVIINM